MSIVGIYVLVSRVATVMLAIPAVILSAVWYFRKTRERSHGVFG